MPINKKYYNLIFLVVLFFSFSIQESFSQSLSDEASSQETPTLKEQKNQDGYIINLKQLINRSKKKIEEVNDKLEDQAKRRRNQQREEKAREYYEQAMRLSREGKLDQAQELWQKAIKITEHPEMKGYISESIVKTKKEQDALRDAQSRRVRRLEVERGYSAEEVEKKYQEGVTLYKQKKLKQAQEAFERVEDMFPDHKATRSYLMVIEQEIQKEQQQRMDNKLKQEMLARQKAKEEWRQELEKREQERQKFLDQQAETIYQDAVKLYRAREFEKAKERFKEVEWVYPNYKSTPYFLSGIDNDISQEEKRQEIERRRELERQMEESKVAKKMEYERQLKLRRQEEETRINSLKEQAEFSYKDGISFYKKGQYQEAKEKFIKVNKQFPNYKQAASYIKQIDEEIDRQKKAEAEKRQKTFELQMRQDRLNKKLIAEEQRRKFQEEEKAQIEKLQKEAELIYKTAVSLFDNELYMQSQEKFMQLEKVYPSYKLAKDYLKKLDVKFRSDRQTQEQAKVLERKRLEEESRKKKEEQQLSVYQKRQNQRLLEKEKEENLKRQAEILYISALSLYDSKLYFQAKEKFLELENFYPNYRSTLRYLKFLERKIPESEPTEDVWGSMRKQNANILMEEGEVVKKAIEERQKKMSQEAEAKYQEALGFYKDKKLVEAQRKFIQVEALYPEYKDTLKYLSLIDDQISLGERFIPSNGKKALFAEDSFDKKKEIEAAAQSRKKIEQQKEQEAALHLKKQAAQPQQDSDQIKEEKQQKARAVFLKKAEQRYQDALNFYQRNLFSRAKEKFLEVQSYEKDYKDVSYYLDLIEEKIAEQAQETKNNYEKATAEDLYRSAMSYYKKRKYQQAKEKFQEVQGLIAGYKSTEKYLALAEEQMQEQKKDQNTCLDACVNDCMERCFGIVESEKVEKIVSKAQVCASQAPSCYDLTDEAEEIYRSAIGLYKRGGYEQAKARFNEVNLLIPGYRNTNSYLDVINRKLEKQHQRQQKEDARGITEKRKEAAEMKEEIQKQIQSKKASWEIGLEQRVALLKAKEKELDSMKGETKEAYKKDIQKEKIALAQLKRKWDQQEKQRKKEFKKRLNEEQRIRRLAQEQQRLLEIKKQKELEEALKIDQAQKKQLEKQKEEELAKLGKAEEEKKKATEAIKNLEAKKSGEKSDSKVSPEQKTEQPQEAADKKQKELGSPSVVETPEYKQYKEEFEKERARKEYDNYRKKQRSFEKKQQEDLARERKQRNRNEMNRKAELKKELSREAGALYQEGLNLYQQGLYEEAKIKFLGAEGLYPGYKSASDYIVKCENEMINQEVSSQEKQKTHKSQEKLNEIEALYQEALQAYQYQDYPAAKEKFSAVLKIDPDYKAAKRYLERCDKKLQEEEKNKKEQEKQQRTAEIKLEKEKTLKEKQEKETAVIKEEQPKATGIEEGSPTEAEKNVQDKKEDKEVQNELENLYQEALSFYKIKDYEKALVKFGDVEKKSPGYKKAKEYLKKCNDLAIKQRERQQKEKEARDLLRKKEDLKKAKEDIEKCFAEMVASYKEQDKDADIKRKQFDKLLMNANLPSEYVQSMKGKMEKELERIKKSIEKKEMVKRPNVEKVSLQKKQEEEKRKQELEKLAKEIRLEEERLMKEKKMQEDKLPSKRVESATEQRAATASKDKKEQGVLTPEQEEHIAKKYVEELRDQKRIALEKEQKAKKESEEALEARRLAEKEKRDQIAKMVKERQQQLEEERERIRKNFSQHIENLYQTAVKLYNQGSYRYAGHMFQEIETMASDYKKTRSYLKDIFKKVSAESVQYPQENTQPASEDLESQTRNVVDDALDAVSVELPR